MKKFFTSFIAIITTLALMFTSCSYNTDDNNQKLYKNIILYEHLKPKAANSEKTENNDKKEEATGEEKTEDNNKKEETTDEKPENNDKKEEASDGKTEDNNKKEEATGEEKNEGLNLLITTMEEITGNYRFKDFTSAIGAIAGGIISDNLSYGNIITAVYSLLSITGIIDGRTPQEKKMDEILDIVKDIDFRLKSFIEDFEKFKKNIDAQFEKIDKKLGEIDYNTNQLLWNGYRDKYIANADVIISKFQSSSRRQLMIFIKNATSGTITATFDADSPIFPGKTLVLPVNASSFDASRKSLKNIDQPLYSDNFVQTIKSDISAMLSAEVSAGKIELGSVKANDVVPYFLGSIMNNVYSEVLNSPSQEGSTYANYIINEYKEFVTATLSGVSESPLLTFYNLTKVFFNFDDECADTLKAGYQHMMFLNFRFASLAMAASQFDSTLTAKPDDIIKSFVEVKDSLKNVKQLNDHSGDKTFSNITKCSLSIRNIEPHASMECWRGWDGQVGYWNTFFDDKVHDHGWKYYDVANNRAEIDISKDPIIDEMDAKKIIGLALGRKKENDSSTDTDYLIKYFSDRFPLDKKDCFKKLLLTKPSTQGISKGDMSLICVDEIIPAGKYFDKNSKYKIDNSGKKDYDCYRIKDCLRSNYFKMDSNDGSLKYFYNSRFLARAFYGEHHWTWPTDEMAYLSGSENDGSTWGYTDISKNDNLVNCDTCCWAFYFIKAH